MQPNVDLTLGAHLIMAASLVHTRIGRNLNAGMAKDRIPTANGTPGIATCAATVAEYRGSDGIAFAGHLLAAVLRQAELQLLEQPSAKTSALVAALRKRYAATAAEYPVKKHKLDLSYAAAMRNVSQMFPTDHHITSFFADALMNTIPWDYYVEGRSSLGHTFKPAAAEARDVLERLLREEPTHEGGKVSQIDMRMLHIAFDCVLLV